MSQDTSTDNKVNTKNIICPNLGQEKSSDISFRLSLPGFHQDRQYLQGRFCIVELCSTRTGACCPVCGAFSQSLKGSYTRFLQGPEILNHPLTLLVKTRKFRCKTPNCSRKVFSEPLSGLASAYARNSLEVEKRIDSVALRTTSRIASELLREQNIFFSPSSCLRRLSTKASDGSSFPAPAAVGIDDFSQKKGHIYGSVVVDQLTHRPVKVLPSREGTELEEYLARNPQIQYITRDRGRCFIDAIHHALPGATQICDRFHLIKNMTDTLTEEIASLSRMGVCRQDYSYPSQEEVRARIMETLLSMGNAGHRKKLNLFIQADNCIRKGMSIGETARKLGVHPQVIWRLVRHHTGKDYMSDRQRSILKHIDELAFEVSRGCTDLKRLKEKMGNGMAPRDIARATSDIRNEIKIRQREIRAYNRSIAGRRNKSHASVREIRHFILYGESPIGNLSRLPNNPDIKYAIGLCREFREMVNGNIRQRSLDGWIDRAIKSGIKAMRTFAEGIKEDRQAVQNAMDIYLNNGVLEGTVNKLKCIKRQMFNRASTRLLNLKLIAFKT